MKPIALCLGGAKSVWEDLAAAKALIGNRPHTVVACNYAGIQYAGRIDAWVTLHPERFQPWQEARAAKGYNTDYRAFVHARRHNQAPAEAVPERWAGSSGLFMAQIALEVLGAAGAILCGVPMEASGRHIHWPGEWGATKLYRPAFLKAQADGAAIRSMSGWTADLLGRPDAAWLRKPTGSKPTLTAMVSRQNIKDAGPMPWVEFTADYKYPIPGKPAHIAYKAGMKLQVTKDCREAAHMAGAITDLKVSNRAAARRLKFQPVAEKTDGDGTEISG